MAGMSRATRKKRHDRELTDPKCFSDCIPIRQPLRSEPVESLLVGSSPRLPWCFALCLGYGWWWWWQRCFSGDSDSCFPIDWQSKLDSYLGVVSPLRLVGNDNVCWGRTLLSFSEARQQQVKWLGSFFSLLRVACPIGPKRRRRYDASVVCSHLALGFRCSRFYYRLPEPAGVSLPSSRGLTIQR